MKKISKKVTNINNVLDYLKFDFCLVSVDNILNINIDNIRIFKKGLFRYLLPGRFINKVKNYFKKHTYINFTINTDILKNYINNKNIIIFNYKKYIFYNNELILRNNNFIINFENFKIYFKKDLLFLISFFI